jgi:hypothetical protein
MGGLISLLFNLFTAWAYWMNFAAMFAKGADVIAEYE